MNWNQLLNTKRLGNREAKEDLGRSPFNSDHDKIIFSGAFRQLARKTQVHPLVTDGHIHNRLTHSLEVACVGRTLGIKVGHALQQHGRLPTGFVPTDLGDIVQSACLAHDIGNPPFGHTGEEAIRSWFTFKGKAHLEGLHPEEKSDLLSFEGNAQGFRILSRSEYHPHDGGMRLTYSTLAAFIKYPWTSLPTANGERPRKNKYGVFQSELALFEEVATSVGLTQKGEHWYARHPLAYLMEIADDMCYAILDLEDGLGMGILRWDDIYEILLPVLEGAQESSLLAELDHLPDARKPAFVRGAVISAYIDAATAAFMAHEDAIFTGEVPDLISLCPAYIAKSVQDAKNMAKDKLFAHPKKVELEIGAYHSIATLLEAMCIAIEEWLISPTDLSYKSKRIIDLIGVDSFDPRLAMTDSPHTPKYLALLHVVDFISGMTDHYATHLARQFNGMGDT